MDMSRFMITPGEKPLDQIVSDGGYCSIFRRIACVGDSLSSGEFESMNAAGERGYHDYFEYSWGQYIAREAGCTVYNFSRGGMTAKEYCNSFAEENGFWDEDKSCQAYIIALGVNDILNQNMELGSTDDINLEDYNKNKETFAGYYGKIIQRYKEIQPKARFFLMSFPKGTDEEISKRFTDLLYQLAELFEFTYVLDIGAYGPHYHTPEFKKQFFLGGHMTPMGYVLTAKIVMSYIDYIIRSQPEDFVQVGFIGTPYYNVTAKW